jgi:metal-dependent amidase/aminoacylase/carboxypeptidase family protein
MTLKLRAEQALTAAKQDVLGLSHRIHEVPELAFAEHEAANRVAELLAGHRFEVQRGVAGLPTALSAFRGNGELVVVFCAEYDALPGLGHACGHNVIAASAVGAALALSDLAGEIDVTVKLLGCPAEETGGGKILMLNEGVFAGADAVMAVHPGPFGTDYVQCRPLASAELLLSYSGDSAAEAAAAIAEAVDALPGLEPFASASCHPAAGPGTTARCSIRAATAEQRDGLVDRVRSYVAAATTARGCSAVVSYTEPPYSHFTGDTEMEHRFAANLQMLGRTVRSHPDDAIYSTDMGNVSLAIPTIHPTLGIDTDTVPHDRGFAAAAVSPSADAAVLLGATAMSWTAIDAATDPQLRARLLDR